MEKDVFIIDAARTAIGNFLGSLKDIKSCKLSGMLIKTLLDRNKILPGDISEVIIGQTLLGDEGQNPARQAAVAGGVPYNVPAFVVSQVCGSGLKSVITAAQSIYLGDNSLVLAGGQESMSTSKHALYVRGAKMGNINASDMMINDGLTDVFNNYHMGITAENLAKKYGISRTEQDEFAYQSQQKASKAQKDGRFKDEIVAVQLKRGNFDEDEFIKHDADIEKMSKLRPAFDKDGTVTAANASGINDGASMLLLAGHAALDKYSLKPIARIVSYGVSGVDPAIMGIGPVDAVKAALSKASWSLNDLDLVEANEAFAVQAIAVNKLLGWDTSKVNVNGGAIALGHPIGTSGARILTTLLYQMKKQKALKGLATLCIGGGMGLALCVENIM